MNSITIGFIGLGAMGQAMLGRLLQAGLSVDVYDLDDAAITDAVKAGAKKASSVASLAKGKNLVFVSVSHADITEKLLCEPNGLLETMEQGGIIVDLGTTPSPQCRHLAKIAQAKGMVFLDAPVSGSTPWAIDGELAMMVGGEEEAFEKIQPILKLFANKIHYLGDSGNGQLLKLCHQLTFVSTLSGISEAIALAERSGQSAQKVLEVLADCVAPKHVIDFMLPLAASGSFDQGRGSLKLLQKDFHAILSSSEDADIELPLSKVLSGYLDKAMNNGWQDSDLFALVDMARQEFLVKSSSEKG